MRRQDYFGQGSRGWLRLHAQGDMLLGCAHVSKICGCSPATVRRSTTGRASRVRHLRRAGRVERELIGTGFLGALERHGRSGRVDGLALFVLGGLDGGGERADLQRRGASTATSAGCVVSPHCGRAVSEALGAPSGEGELPAPGSVRHHPTSGTTASTSTADRAALDQAELLTCATGSLTGTTSPRSNSP